MVSCNGQGESGMQVIYLDVLIGINLYVTFFLLKATARMLHFRIAIWRTCLACAVGGVSSLMIFAEQMHPALTFSVKFLCGILIVLTAFGFFSVQQFLKRAGIFLAVNFLFAGVMLALWWGVAPIGMYYRNGTVYFDISAAVLALSTIVAYLAVTVIRRLLDRKSVGGEKLWLMVTVQDRTVHLSCFGDSGNTLKDIYTGKPVIICDAAKLQDVLPDHVRSFATAGMAGMPETPSFSNYAKAKYLPKFIPYHVVGKNGILPAFRADRVTLQTEDGKEKELDVLIGIAEQKLFAGEYDAIINPELLV